MTFILYILKIVSLQLAGVVGIFFFLGFILSFLQEHIQKIYYRKIGWFGILWTAWLGTPIHELGHVFFALLFRHKITKISLFSPDKVTGKLGHVDYSYNPLNIFQRIGNFFVGAGPMLFGSGIMVFLLYILVPNAKEIFLPLSGGFSFSTSLVLPLTHTLRNIFSLQHFFSWQFILFLYISFCVSSHMAPSKPDRKNMWHGFFWIVLILIIVNIVAYLLKANPTEYIFKVNQYLGIFSAMFLYAIVMSVIHFIFISAIFLPFRSKNKFSS